MNFDNIIRPACNVSETGCTDDQYLLDGVCVDCPPQIVTITANATEITAGETVGISWGSNVLDLDSSVVTIEYGGTVITVTRNAAGSLVFTPTEDTTYTIQAVTECGTVEQSVTVAVTEAPPCVCPEGMPDCLILAMDDPADFSSMCNPITDGFGDSSLWDGTMPLLGPCRWGVEFSEDEIGIGGVGVNFTTPTSGQFKAIVELISCDPFVYEMTFYTRARDGDNVLTEYPFWKGRVTGHPIGTYITQHYGVGAVDGYCYPDTDFDTGPCVACTKPTVRFDPPSGSVVNFPTLVFLHASINGSLLYYGIDEDPIHLYTGPISLNAGQVLKARSIGPAPAFCAGDEFTATYTSDPNLEFEFICDGPNDKAGVFGVFAANGVANDYHFRMRVTRGAGWTLRDSKIYETDEEGNWISGQAWATISPIQPIEGPPDFAVYPLVFFNTVPTQLNSAYADPVASFSAGLTELHAYGQPFVPLTGYFRLELTMDEGGDPFTIYKLIPHVVCDPPPPPCPEAQSVIHYAECDGTITLTGTLQIGYTYRLYRAELAPCGNGVHSIVSEFITTQVPWEFLDSGTNDCSYSFFLSVYCPSTEQWIDGPVSTVLVPPVCDVPTEFCNTDLITIPTFETASPYPSVITVAGRPGVVIKAIVQIFEYQHGFPDDVEILLVGPDGTKVLLMNDVFGGGPNAILAPGVGIVFDDAASASMGDNGPQLIPGNTYDFKPTSPVTSDGTYFSGSAPPPPYATTLSAFIGKPCNGVWKLFVNDDRGNHSGSIKGWCLQLSLA